MRFRDELEQQHQTDRLHLLFNNAGIGGGGGSFTDTRDEWERTFNVCWGGVYLGCPHLPADDAGRRRGPHRQHRLGERLLGQPGPQRLAHRLCGGEVRGEGLHRGADHRPPAQRAAHQVLGGDARPHRHLDRRQLPQGDPGRDEDDALGAGIWRPRASGSRAGVAVAGAEPDEQIAAMVAEQARRFLEDAPTTGRAGGQDHPRRRQAERWRILVGDDAHRWTNGCGRRRSRPTPRSFTRAIEPKSAGARRRA